MSKWLIKASEKTERAKSLIREFLTLWGEIRGMIVDGTEEMDEELKDLLVDLEESIV